MEFYTVYYNDIRLDCEGEHYEGSPGSWDTPEEKAYFKLIKVENCGVDITDIIKDSVFESAELEINEKHY